MHQSSSDARGRSELDALATELDAPGTADLDLRTTAELVELMNREDASVPAAVAAAGPRIASAIEGIVGRLRRGGRLVYVGAGSSGRLAAVDAAECETTFSARPGQVVALVAGAALPSPVDQEAAEDDAEAGALDVEALRVDSSDALVAVSASGRTPYVVGAVEAARVSGALTACVVSVLDSPVARLCDHEIPVLVGAEVVAGSTRLKSGTAQKLVLNTISTVSMIRLGKTYGNLMVDVRGANEKLRARARRAVMQATGSPEHVVDAALAEADGNAKVAIVSLLAGVGADEARERLAAAGDSVRATLE